MTRDDTDGRARRGYLILAGIFLAAVLIFNLNAVMELAAERVDIIALVSDASGVRVGTPVRIAGVESGRITGISFPAAGQTADVAIHMRLKGEGLSVVRRDSDVRAIRLRVIGQPVVQIDAGSPGEPRVQDGDTLHARPRPDPRLLLEQGKRLPAALDTLMTAARQVAGMARDQMPELARLQESVDRLGTAAGELSLGLEGGSLGPMLAPGGLAGIGRLRLRLEEVSATVDRAMERYRGAGEEPSALTASLEALRGRVTALRLDVDALTVRMEEGGGILWRMPRDSAIQVAIHGVQAQIDSVRQEAASIVRRMVVP